VQRLSTPCAVKRGHAAALRLLPCAWHQSCPHANSLHAGKLGAGLRDGDCLAQVGASHHVPAWVQGGRQVPRVACGWCSPSPGVALTAARGTAHRLGAQNAHLSSAPHALVLPRPEGGPQNRGQPRAHRGQHKAQGGAQQHYAPTAHDPQVVRMTVANHVLTVTSIKHRAARNSITHPLHTTRRWSARQRPTACSQWPA